MVSRCFCSVGDQGFPPVQSFHILDSIVFWMSSCCWLMALDNSSSETDQPFFEARCWTVWSQHSSWCWTKAGCNIWMYLLTSPGSEGLSLQGFGGASLGDWPRNVSLTRSNHKTQWLDGQPLPKGRYPKETGKRQGVVSMVSISCRWKFFLHVAVDLCV